MVLSGFDVGRTGYIQFQASDDSRQTRAALVGYSYRFVVVNNQVDTAEIKHQQSPQQFSICFALVGFSGILERQIQRSVGGVLRSRRRIFFRRRRIRSFSAIPISCDNSCCCFLSLRICVDTRNSLFE